MVRARNGRRGHDLRSRRAQRWWRIRRYRQRLPHLDLAGARDRGVLKEQSLSRCAGPIPGLARPTKARGLISAFLGPSPFDEPFPPTVVPLSYISSDEAWHWYLCTLRNRRRCCLKLATYRPVGRPHVAATDDYRQKFLNRSGESSV